MLYFCCCCKGMLIKPFPLCCVFGDPRFAVKLGDIKERGLAREGGQAAAPAPAPALGTQRLPWQAALARLRLFSSALHWWQEQRGLALSAGNMEPCVSTMKTAVEWGLGLREYPGVQGWNLSGSQRYAQDSHHFWLVWFLSPPEPGDPHIHKPAASLPNSPGHRGLQTRCKQKAALHLGHCFVV